jgi:anti-sigma regulatory factor (Ser/Thr protein kinase)
MKDHPARSGSPEVLTNFTVPSEPGNERRAIEQVEKAVRPLGLPGPRLERLKTAVAEATMNAMEHGNGYRAEVPVEVDVLHAGDELLVRITDRGGGQEIPEPESPDLEAKLESRQTPRGWGLFLIQSMVDELRVTTDEVHHTVELVLNLKGEDHASEAS